MFFILIGFIITFLVAAGISYSHNHNVKGAIFLVIGIISIIATYQYYEASHNKKKNNNYTGSTNYDSCSYWDCGHVLNCPTSADCHKVEKIMDFDCNNIDCGSMDCNGGDCHSG